jgi:sirohydrochlorin ferrochelatase
MRPARLIPDDRPAVVLVAHGSRDPRAAASTEALAHAVRRAHPEWTVHASYLDHAGPRPLDVLTALPPGRRAVVVPLLLTAAYHGRVDVPAILAEAARLRLDVRLAEVLGPLPASLSTPALRRAAARAGRGMPGAVPTLLIDGLIRRLRAVGLDAVGLDAVGPDAVGLDALGTDAVGLGPAGAVGAGSVGSGAVGIGGVGSSAVGMGGVASGAVGVGGVASRAVGVGAAGLDAVVLAAAGTRDAAARETITWAAEAVSVRLSLPCTVAYASAAPPTAGEAVARLRAGGARRVGVAAYFLAPGRLHDLAARSALEAGAAAVAKPLGDAPEMVRLIADRVGSAAARSLVTAA